MKPPAFLPVPAILPRRHLRLRRWSTPRCSQSGSDYPPDDALVDDANSAYYLSALENGETLPAGYTNRWPSVAPDKTKDQDRPAPSSNAGAQQGVVLGQARSAQRRRGVPPVRKAPFSLPGSVGALSDTTDGAQAHRAPNGLPNSGPADLWQELLPLLAQAEQEETRMMSAGEKMLREKLGVAADQFASMHRSSERLMNLRPFQLREEGSGPCEACEGQGMVVCGYCKGEGFVDLGENGEKFSGVIDGMVVELPKKVMGSTFHCPLCGGLTKERCVECLGTGKARHRERVFGEADEEEGQRAWKVFDLEKFLEQEKDRVEYGLDGAIILRAKRRKRRKKTTASADDVDSAGTGAAKAKKKGRTKAAAKAVGKGGRGKGRKRAATVKEGAGEQQDGGSGDAGDAEAGGTVDGDGIGSQVGVVVERPAGGRGAGGRAQVVLGGRSVGRSTDFMYTTDYKVGRRLRKDRTAGERDGGADGGGEGGDGADA